MPSTDVVARRALRESPWGKAAILVAILLAAFIASRSCASRETEVSRDEAIVIAREEIDYEPDCARARFIPRGFQSRPTWAVSLVTVGAGGMLERVAVVVVDGRTGDVLEIRTERSPTGTVRC
jgi:hypothetical protein